MYIEVFAEATPNPNSIKFTLNKTILDKGSKHFMSPEDAKGDTLASKIFTVQGVKSVFLMGNFISVLKDSQSDWNEMLPKVESVIKENA